MAPSASSQSRVASSSLASPAASHATVPATVLVASGRYPSSSESTKQMSPPSQSLSTPSPGVSAAPGNAVGSVSSHSSQAGQPSASASSYPTEPSQV